MPVDARNVSPVVFFVLPSVLSAESLRMWWSDLRLRDARYVVATLTWVLWHGEFPDVNANGPYRVERHNRMARVQRLEDGAMLGAVVMLPY